MSLLDELDEPTRRRLRRESVPEWAEPMLATRGGPAFSDPDWIFERKLDGVRCLAFRDGKAIRLRSRAGHHLNRTYPELVDPMAASVSDRFVVDGEVVAFHGRVTSFSRLQQRMQVTDPDKARASGVAVYLYLFDLLHVEGSDTTRLALRDRKALLKRLFPYRDPLRYTAHRNADGEAFYRDACARGWEGLIAKYATTPYEHVRSSTWLKLKCVERQEFVIGGFTDPAGSRAGFGAILVGYHDEGRLRYAGKVGTGFDTDTLRRLGERMERLEREESPFAGDDLPTGGVHWVAPRLVAEIAFTEWTNAGKLRQPRYLGLRHDKDPEEVVREVPA